MLSERLPLLPTDREAPWTVVPSPVRDALDSMLIDNDSRASRLLGEMQGFQAQMGVKTALNRVFLVKRVEPVPEAHDEVVIYTEGYYSQQVPENQKRLYRARVEKSLIRPIVRGADVEAWRYRQRDYILWTHDDETGRVLQEIPPKAKSYFQQHIRALQHRDDYRDGMPMWTIFRVSSDKLRSKVVWQELSNKLEVAVVPDDPQVIPIQTAYLVAAPTMLAHGLAAFLNSTPIRLYTAVFAERARGAYFRHFSWVLGALPLPEHVKVFLEGASPSQDFERLIEISQALHENPQRADRTALEAELDSIVARLYGLTEAQLGAMREYYAFITPSQVMVELADVVEEEASEVDE
jgi:hypothetical protein